MPTRIRRPDDCHMRASAAASHQINWKAVSWLAGYHLVALLALLPWFFSWAGVVVAVASHILLGLLGINIGYHRLLSHRSFSCPRWLEHTFAVLGVCCAQESPAFWISAHRWHHHFADKERDPHSPLVNLLWAHVGWLLVKHDGMPRERMIERYAPDIMRDPLYAWFERNYNWSWVLVLSWLVYFAGGFGAAVLIGENTAQALQFGLSVLVWGVFVRTVVGWHIAWSVNSMAHRWGYQNYATNDNSRNNFFVALYTNGEGWHNNHHADPGAARHGHRWWEFDVTYALIRFLAALGLVKDVVLPSVRRHEPVGGEAGSTRDA
jgi:stearoyl-CoA desaturase (delta-9 desaturase)